MSSSSEDDCYSNSALKLQSLKNKWAPGPDINQIEDESDPNDTLNDSTFMNMDVKPDVKAGKPKKKTPKKRKGAKINSDDSCSSLNVSQYGTRSRSKRTPQVKNSIEDYFENAVITSLDTTSSPAAEDSIFLSSRGSRRGRRGSRRGASSNLPSPFLPEAPTFPPPPPGLPNAAPLMMLAAIRSRARGRGRNRRRTQQAYRNIGPLINLGCWSDEEGEQLPLFNGQASAGIPVTPTPRGRGRGRGRPRANPVLVQEDILNITESPLKIDSDLENENEELSLKVHWRSKEYHKFNIRKYQKLTTIFEFFSKLEKVPQDHLLFTLKNRVLQPQDTPSSINYNICQFIDGGVVSQTVVKMAQESTDNIVATENKNMITIKLQTKLMKTPFEIKVDHKQKMSFVMMRFSEEQEIPLNRLKFYFDGDVLSPASTLQDLDMEGGECIDVNVIG